MQHTITSFSSICPFTLPPPESWQYSPTATLQETASRGYRLCCYWDSICQTQAGQVLFDRLVKSWTSRSVCGERGRQRCRVCRTSTGSRRAEFQIRWTEPIQRPACWVVPANDRHQQVDLWVFLRRSDGRIGRRRGCVWTLLDCVSTRYLNKSSMTA